MELPPDSLALLAFGVFAVALLYSAVGNAGSSGYLAVMSLMGITQEVFKPLSLVLNLLVATIGTIQFYRAGCFSWSLFWPFAVASVPAAFFGGYVDLPTDVFRLLVGSILLASSVLLLMKVPTSSTTFHPAPPVSLASGAVIGFLSGLSGTGGGIFLTPWLLFQQWATPRTAAGVTMPFLLVNSLAALAGSLNGPGKLPTFSLALLAAAAIGGLLGSHLGSRNFPPAAIMRILAGMLILAGIKLILT